MVHFKYGKRGASPRISLRNPFPSHPDPVYELLRKVSAADSAPSAYIFPGRSPFSLLTAAELRSSLNALVANLQPPVGTKYTARSLRSGVISVAYAAGVRLETIMHLYTHTSSEVVHERYLDVILTVSHAVRLFFSLFAPSAVGL